MEQDIMPFLPVFGHRPSNLVGREQAVSDFLAALSSAPGHRSRVNLIAAHKGMGKTALLAELESWAQAQGYACLRSLPDESVFSEMVQLSVEHKVFVGIDNITCCTSALRAVAQAYVQLSSKGKEIVLVCAGRPDGIERMLANGAWAALRGAHRISLGPLPAGQTRGALRSGFAKAQVNVAEDVIALAAEQTGGHPFLLQLVGSHLLYAAKDGAVTRGDALQALDDAMSDLDDQLLVPMLAALSNRDLEVLQAMATLGGSCTSAQLRAQLGIADNYLQPYRARLIKSGVIYSPRRGQLAFALPHLLEYLQALASQHQK